VSAVAETMQSTSQTLCREIPDIVRQAVKADLREFPRYDVNLIARLEYGGGELDVVVFDVSQGGARMETVERLAVGDQIDMTLPGMKAIAAEIARAGKHFDLRFMPARLRPEELHDLVTVTERAA
jgi:PilZ domain